VPATNIRAVRILDVKVDGLQLDQREAVLGLPDVGLARRTDRRLPVRDLEVDDEPARGVFAAFLVLDNATSP
jgi:hypothetical protein